ncbi:MAG TPA: helix-hairpin-helix domain-containing protein, partial [Chloroflexota bacterium]|nr:helix-hairpin-helix domain-containing protein [Chloroflexota bacterium]
GPSLERETRAALTERAEEHAIGVFAANLRPLLLQPPVRGKTVVGIDPGYRTGCKVAVVDHTGKALEMGAIFPHPPQARAVEARAALIRLARTHRATVFAIGTGTASRETEFLVAEVVSSLGREYGYVMVDEAGASVYSVSELAREEFPDLDATARGAISIGRRLQDPLAELVKVDPRSIGVGLYQHDVDQTSLAGALDRVVESAVNYAGVDVNTASAALLRRVAGLNRKVAGNIVQHRNEHGQFRKRLELKKVLGLGPRAFEQAAGFLRVPDGEDILDRTFIHPESYAACRALIERMPPAGPGEALPVRAARFIADLAAGRGTRAALANQLGIGEPTLSDMLDNLAKPGVDPRAALPPPVVRTSVLTMDALKPGMVVQGTVRNVVDFGAFVDIGLKQAGLVHVSELADRFVRSPLEVVQVGQVVTVRVVSVDEARGRIGLSMRSQGS